MDKLKADILRSLVRIRLEGVNFYTFFFKIYLGIYVLCFQILKSQVFMTVNLFTSVTIARTIFKL